MGKKEAVLVTAAALALCAATAARAAEGDEHLSLSGGLPVTIEDAGSIQKGDIDTKLRFYYENQRKRGARNLLTVDPEIEVGVAPNLSFGVSPSYSLGNASGAQSGEVEFEIEYSVLPQSGSGTGILIEPLVSIPYGYSEDAVEAGLALRVTQPLTGSPTGPRLHLNARLLHLFDSDDGQRDNRYFLGAGVNFTVAPRTALALDVIREQSQERGSVENLVEAGVRHELMEKLSVGFGAGVGIGPDSPRYRLLLGLQKSF
ncbi:hypothetical protein [Azospirillum sp. SYSU D00513]|uniref:hypothetical protein n=1 Tax=Azospirillum sp. SYSU D00513 TaxID=2812561 RepID=UPI001FFF52BC|nr:hypothetical protein [Azospirillum sp. SYSU D00513]